MSILIKARTILMTQKKIFLATQPTSTPMIQLNSIQKMLSNQNEMNVSSAFFFNKGKFHFHFILLTSWFYFVFLNPECAKPFISCLFSLTEELLQAEHFSLHSVYCAFVMSCTRRLHVGNDMGKSLQSLQQATVFITRHADSLEQIHRRIDTSTQRYIIT